MTPQQIKPPQSRWRFSIRILYWIGALTLCLLPFAAIVHSLVVRQMRLPRLVLTPGGDVMAVTVAPGGKAIFAGTAFDALRDRGNKPADIYVWDGASDRLMRRLHGLCWRSSGVTASPDGRQIIAVGEAHGDAPDTARSRTVVWDWRSGRNQWSIEGDTPLSYSQDGRLIGYANGVFDAATGKLVCRTSKHIAEDGQSGFTPDGKLFGLIDDLKLDPKTGREITPNNEHYTYSTTQLHFWRADTGKEAKSFPFTRVRSFDISRDGHWLVLVSDADGVINGTDGSVVRRVDFNSGKTVWTRERRENGPDADPESVLNSVAVLPNGKYVVLASMNSHLIILDAGTGRELFRPFIPPGTTVPNWALPGGLAFSADGKTLVSRCGRRVLVWDASVLQ